MTTYISSPLFSVMSFLTHPSVPLIHVKASHHPCTQFVVLQVVCPSSHHLARNHPSAYWQWSALCKYSTAHPTHRPLPQPCISELEAHCTSSSTCVNVALNLLAALWHGAHFGMNFPCPLNYPPWFSVRGCTLLGGLFSSFVHWLWSFSSCSAVQGKLVVTVVY